MIMSTEGDAGDICYAASLLHGLGGEHTVLLQKSDKTKARGEEGLTNLYTLVAPLLESQPYIKECRRIAPEDKVEWASAKFRQQGHYSVGETLMEAHRKWLTACLNIGQGLRGQTKWLTAIPDKRSAGKIVINRTGRYRNEYFPWKEVVKHYSHRLVFVGLHHEWREFCSHFGYVDFQPTGNLLQVAQIIAGSELFIGNQSCAFAVAEGLKHPRILEVSLEFPDTIFGGGQYVVDGTADLPDIEGSGELHTPSKAFAVPDIQAFNVPPGGWQYESEETGLVMGSMLETCMRDVRRRLRGKAEPTDLERVIVAQNIQRVPRFFAKFAKLPSFSRVKAALESAGITTHPVIELMAGKIQFNV